MIHFEVKVIRYKFYYDDDLGCLHVYLIQTLLRYFNSHYLWFSCALLLFLICALLVCVFMKGLRVLLRNSTDKYYYVQ